MAVAIVVAQLLSVAAVSARMCLPRAHTHGGVSTPDCPMHNGRQARASDAASHHHHSHSTASPATEVPGDARLTCQCDPDGFSVVSAPAVSAEPDRLKTPVARDFKPSYQRAAFNVDLTPLSPPPRFPRS
jgi:hypothetical protein